MIRKTVLLLCACEAFLWAGKVVTTQNGEVITTPRSSATPTRLLFAFASTQAGFDTEITISNTSQDTSGSVPQAGTCTLNFYGANAPGASTSASIAAGKQLVFNLSQGGGGIPAAPSFWGYIVASCGFPLGRGTAKVFTAKVFAAGKLGYSNDAQVLTTPRSTANPQYLLFPYVTNQSGYDTFIGISNTSSDPFGTTHTSGSCTLWFYGANAPAAFLTPNVPAGALFTTMASNIAANFQGYVIAGCNFADAAGMAFESDLGTEILARSETPELLTLPRGSAARPLLFSSVTNQNGMDTGILIANTTMDPFGTTPASGSCTLNFYGANAPSSFVTPNIPAGTVYGAMASNIAPNFQGYVIASCPFPLSRGWAFLTPLGVTGDGDSETPEIITTPRSATPAPLLFTAATNRNGSDTNITISNTSQDPFGTSQLSGTCTISYFGDVLGGGNVPSPQISGLILAGSQLSFSLSQGNPAQGIAATPGFRGYVMAACNFPLARGLATVRSTPASKAGVFRSGFFWLLDADGNQQLNSPPDKVFAFGGIPGDIPITGDWNGSGTTKVGVYRSSNGLFILDYDGDGQFTAADKVYSLGVGTQPGDIPVVGDWNGDGTSKIGIFRQGFFWILDTNGNGTFDAGDQAFAYGGVAGDVPVVGDWNGNGTSKVGVFRAGFLWILDTNGSHAIDAGDQIFPFGGIPGDVPVVGDWNGDGTSKVGVFRMGFFWVLDINGNQVFDAGTDQAFAFGGMGGDIPVVGKW